MDYIKYTRQLTDFIENSPSSYHAAANIADMLTKNGCTELFEEDSWDLTPGKKYFVRRNSSSIITFGIPKKDYSGYMIISSHSDSPSFKIKPSPSINTAGLYTSLNTERYGGMIYSTWFDRPLSVAGRVLIETENGIKETLVNIDRDILMLPSLAPHLDPSANKKEKYDLQTELIPLMCIGDNKDVFMSLISEYADTSVQKILGFDLFLYNRQPATVWGANNDFFSSPRIDNLQCAFSSASAFINSNNTNAVTAAAIFDNEEVGSGTRQGALSTFLQDTLKRVNYLCGKTDAEYIQDIASSMALSADNGHALHPNYPSNYDITNKPVPNGGVLIKYNAAQHYTTDAVSEAVLKKILNKNNIPYMTYVNRSNIVGGSTLGHLSTEQVSVLCADIGAPMLAMHSSYETGGTKDTKYLIDAMTAFFNTTLKKTHTGYDII